MPFPRSMMTILVSRASSTSQFTIQQLYQSITTVRYRYPHLIGIYVISDGDTVTFYHNRHEDGTYVNETRPIIDLIKHLIRHIQEEHFKMICYGGLYARYCKINSKLHRAISREKLRIFRSFTQWRTIF